MMQRPRWLRGPYPVLPRFADALSERWARLPPRVRLAVICWSLVLVVVGVQARVRHAESRWGGAPIRVLVATADLPVGAEPQVRAVELPPRAVPPKAASQVPADAVLSLALPQGAVLTESHLSASGPAAGLADELRVVPVPIEAGWGVAVGGWVDVWVLGAGEQPAVKVASSRPVLEVHSNETGTSTALVGLGPAEVGPATSGLALGRILLAHAPPP